ncbi:MAG: carboxymuconolactone decarboxylase family protein [Planctomycetota bacterium]
MSAGAAPELLELALATLAGDRPALERLVAAGRPDRRWRETLLQTALFAGIPRVVAAWGHVSAAGGLGAPDGDELLEADDPDAAGAACFAEVYGRGAEAVHTSLVDFHPLFARWIREFAYGRVLARPGLSLGERETLAVACLAALNLPRQLASHVRGAQRAGVAPDEIQGALERGLALAPAEKHEALRAIGRRFLLD